MAGPRVTTSVRLGTKSSLSPGGGALIAAAVSEADRSGMPQAWQKCADESLAAWHDLQNLRSRLAPHSVQNFASDGLARLQCRQIK